MAQSKIEWTERTWNPSTGCNKISQGCRGCYAEVMHKRLMALYPAKYSRPFLDGAFPHEPSIPIPFSWSKKPKMVFLDSMSDLFHKNLPVEFVAKCYAVMFLTPYNTYQILTKRPERRKEIFHSDEFFEHLWRYCNKYHDEFIKPLDGEMYQHVEITSLFPFKNIWEGASVEDKDNLWRIDELRNTRAHVRFLSCEPLIEDLGEINLSGIHQCIVGGESGHNKRPFNTEWAYNILNQCRKQKVAFFMKQIDKVQPVPKELLIREYPQMK